MEDAAQSPHRRVWDLIPWVVAGSASGSERRLVEQHAAACADCRDELAFHQRLRAGMEAEAAPAHDPNPALRRLWGRIDRADGAPANAVPPLPAAGLRRTGWTRVLVAAVVLQSIGLATLIGVVSERPRAADYQTLGGAESVRPPVAASIRVVPAPSLRLVELRALLGRAGLQIVESAGNASILGVAPLPGSATEIGETLQRLRAEPGVLLAEPIDQAVETRP